MRFCGALLAVLGLAGLSACGSVEYDLVGSFSDYNEVFYGHVIADLSTGSGEVVAVSKPSGMTCRGSAGVTYVPPGLSFSCHGQRGEGQLFCDDGRMVNVRYDIDSCTSGYGGGVDQHGNTLTFVFGLSEKEALEKIRTMNQKVANKPKLPVYNPKENVEKEGFATGTAFFVTSTGYALTNYHVVDGGNELIVVFPDGHSAKSQVVQVDPQNDVALLKVDEKTRPLPVSSVDGQQKGNEVATLGYPLIMVQGQESKATFGRINALSGFQNDMRYMQIDAAIQPGNSGGPLFDDQGNVIGITTMTLDAIAALKISGTLPQSINYALKADYALPLLNAIPRKDRKTASIHTRHLSMPDIIKESDPSVVLVIVRQGGPRVSQRPEEKAKKRSPQLVDAADVSIGLEK